MVRWVMIKMPRMIKAASRGVASIRLLTAVDTSMGFALATASVTVATATGGGKEEGSGAGIGDSGVATASSSSWMMRKRIGASSLLIAYDLSSIGVLLLLTPTLIATSIPKYL